MALRLSALSLAFIAAAAAAGPVPKVVNGAAAPLTDYPWMFHLVSGDPARPSLNDHYCGGAYLGDGIAVTARHCVLPSTAAGGWYGCIGNSLSVNRNNCFPVVAAVRHEGALDPEGETGIADLGEGGSGDMALVRLSGAPAGLPFMTLPTAAEDASVAADEALTVIGYGSTRYESYSAATELRQQTLPRQADSACAAKIGLTLSELGSDVICVATTPSGAAPGDSGSPLLMRRNGQPLPVALVSHGTDYTSYFVRYAPYRDWFAAQLNDAGWQQESKRTLDLVLVEGEEQAEAQISVHNWSNQPQPLTASLVGGATSLFAVDTAGCSQVPALGSCQLLVSVEGPLTDAVGDELLVQVGEQLSRYPLHAVPAATALDAPVAELNLVATGGWQATANGLTLASGEDWGAPEAISKVGDVAVAVVEGPLQLAMRIESSTFNGQALALMVDGQLHSRYAGRCSNGRVGLSLGSGQHQIEWRGPRGEASVSVSELAVVDTAVATSEPLCVAQSKQLSEQPDDSIDADDDGGGGSWGVGGLLALALLLWRRGR